MKSKQQFRYYCAKCRNEWTGSDSDVYCCQCDTPGFVVVPDHSVLGNILIISDKTRPSSLT